MRTSATPWRRARAASDGTANSGVPKNTTLIARAAGLPDDVADQGVLAQAAEALGATYRGRPVGGFGRLAIFSFNGNKIITTSGGGMLVSEDAELVRRARFLATQARDPAPHYQHSAIGYNYRLSNVLAAIGRVVLVLEDKRAIPRYTIAPSQAATEQERLAAEFAHRFATAPPALTFFDALEGRIKNSGAGGRGVVFKCQPRLALFLVRLRLRALPTSRFA